MLASLLLFFCSLIAVAGQSGESLQTALFINTVPLHARVLLDGKELADATPLLIRGLSPGRHLLSVLKEGFVEQNLEFDISQNEVKAINLSLESESFDLIFPSEELVVFPEQEQDAVQNYFKLDQGIFKMERRGRRLTIEPLFPQQSLIDGLTVAIPVFLGFAAFLTVDALINPPDTGIAVPPAVIAAHVASVTLIGLHISLNFAKKKYNRSFSAPAVDRKKLDREAEEIFLTAEDLLYDGRVEEALLYLAQIVDGQSESKYFPLALYKQSRIHFMLGNYAESVEGFDLLVTRYPTVELYDKARKNLADIFFDSGSYDRSIHQLDAMVFRDPLYSKEDIELLKSRIRAAKHDHDPDALKE